MALIHLITVLFLAVAFSRIELTSSSVVKGSLICTDCAPNYDFSGIKVLVKCDGVKKLSTAVSESNGGFTTELPTDSSILTSPNQVNCLAKLIGGPTQIYALKNIMVSKIVLAKGDDDGDDENHTKGYTLVSPLSFSESCHGKCDSVGSSKTINLPIPREYGLPPTSYYMPFLPIIGIP